MKRKPTNPNTPRKRMLPWGMAVATALSVTSLSAQEIIDADGDGLSNEQELNGVPFATGTLLESSFEQNDGFPASGAIQTEEFFDADGNKWQVNNCEIWAPQYMGAGHSIVLNYEGSFIVTPVKENAGIGTVSFDLRNFNGSTDFDVDVFVSEDGVEWELIESVNCNSIDSVFPHSITVNRGGTQLLKVSTRRISSWGRGVNMDSFKVTSVDMITSDPNNADSNSNGMNDGDEVALGLIPTDPDSDNDGISNVDEMAKGLNPFKSDSDGDGFSDAEELAGLKLNTEVILESSFDVADSFPEDGDIQTEQFTDAAGNSWKVEGCEIWNPEYLGAGQSIVINPEGSFTVSPVKENAGIGTISFDLRNFHTATDFDVDIFVSADGIEWELVETVNCNSHTRAYPHSIEVNREGNQQLKFAARRLSSFGRGVHVDSLSVTGLKVFYTNPAMADTNSNEISDFEEFSFGLDPTDPDTDKDGVKNIDELALGLDPLDQDTDDDGLTDAEEIAGFTKDSGLWLSSSFEYVEGFPETGAVDEAPFLDPSGNEWFVTDCEIWSPEYLGDDNSMIINPDGSFKVVAANKAVGVGSISFDLRNFHTGTEFEVDILSSTGGTEWDLIKTVSCSVTEESASYSIEANRLGVSQIKFVARRISSTGRGVHIDSLKVTGFQTAYTNPGNADTNNNGIIDSEEFVLGSDPTSLDSDGDHIPNDVEIADGTDPLEKTSYLPEGWKSTDIGYVGMLGETYSYKGSYELAGSGSDIWNTRDSFHYLYAPQSGDFEFTTKVDSLERTHGWARAGLMMRASTAEDSLHVMIAVTPDNGCHMMVRTVDGGSTVIGKEPKEVTAPAWLKLIRKDLRIIGYASENGTDWVYVDEVNFKELEADMNVGMAVCSYKNSTLATARFSNMTLGAISDADGDGLNDIEELVEFGTDVNVADTDGDSFSDYEECIERKTNPRLPEGALPEGWTNTDIGEVSAPGMTVAYGDTWRLIGSDPGYTYDARSCNFTYRELTGNGQIIAKMDSVDHGYSDLMLMMRDSLEKDANEAMIYSLAANYNKFMWRGDADTGFSGGDNNYDSLQGKWVKLVRNGSRIAAFQSPDGVEWGAMGSVELPELAETIYVGVGLTTFTDWGSQFAEVSGVQVLPVEDTDNDGLTDFEENYLYYTDVNSADTDADGISDLAEVTAGTSPVFAATAIDGKDVHKTGLAVSYYHKKYDLLPDFDTQVPYKVDVLETTTFNRGYNGVHKSGRQDNVAMEARGYLYVPADGAYTFYLHSDDGSSITLDGEMMFLNDGHGSAEELTSTVNLEAGWHSIGINYFQVGGGASFKLAWSTETMEKQVITSKNLMHAQSDIDAMKLELDSDEDTVLDVTERELGTDPFSTDTDGDRIDDAEEIALGSNPLSVDTDGDGINDYIEIRESYTNPTVAEFDGTITDVQTVAGNNILAAHGTWEEDGDTIVAKRARGYVEYGINIPAEDAYRLTIDATHLWLKYSCSPVSPIDNSDLMIYIDGKYIGKKNLVAPDGIYGTVAFITPYLTAGEHTVRIFWENVHSRISLQIKDLKVQTLGGPDSDNDGVKDWVETSIATTDGIDVLPATSYVSPICVEGKGRFVDQVTIQTNLTPNTYQLTANNQGAGDRWFTDVELSNNAATEVKGTFQNGGMTQVKSTTWTALNLLDAELAPVTLRVGDSLMLTAVKDSNRADVTINVDGTDYALEYIPGNANGQNSPQVVDEKATVIGEKMTYKFTEEGTFTVSAVFDPRGNGKGKEAVTSETLTVNVISALPQPTEEPAFLLGKRRTWTYTGLPETAVVEADDTVTLERDGERLTITMSKTNKPHNLVVRAYEGGPVMQTVTLKPFWIQAAVDSYFWVVERHDDYEIWENSLIAKNVPEDVEIRIAAWISGVQLDDGSISRTITVDDLDELGEYKFRLIHPNTLTHSACHTIRAYQKNSNGTSSFIGEAYYSGALMPEDE